MKMPCSPDEAARLEALRSYSVLDTAPEPEYDRIVQLATSLFGVPIALVSLVDEKRQWFKARQGWNLVQTARPVSFCSHAIQQEGVMMVPDTQLDPRFAGNPLVTGATRIRFYAGAPLTTPEGFNLGALCLMDRRPRRLGPEKLRLLQLLASVVVDSFQLRRTIEVNRQLATVVEGTDTAVVTLDTAQSNRPITYVNSAFLRMTGYRPEEVIGHSPLLLQGPETDQETVQQIRAAIVAHRPYRGRIICYRKDGSKFCNELTVRPVFDPQGRLTHYVGLQTNVTEQQQAEESLRLERARFAHLAAHEPGMIYQWTTYRDGTPRGFRFVSEGSRQIFGLEPTAIMAEPDFLFYRLCEEERGAFAHSLAQAAAELTPWQWQGWVQTPECPRHHEKWLLVKGSPTRLAGGEVLWNGLILEETPPCQPEKGLCGAADDESSNQLTTQLLACLQTELRGPLQSVVKFGQALAPGATGNDHPRELHRLVEAGQRLLRLVDKTAQVVGQERLCRDGTGDAVPVFPLLQEALNAVRPLATSQNVHVHEPGCGAALGAFQDLCVAGDPTRLRQILVSLCSNAVKFNVPGGYLKVACKGTADGRQVRIVVADNGIGIPPAVRHRLFTPFDRLGLEASSIPGTGLSLVCAKRLTEAMGGSLSFEANPAADGQGAVFCVELPRRFAATPPTGRTSPASASNGVPVPPTRSATILYIEDNQANLQLVARLLAEHPQLQLLTAMQGSLGLDLARSHQPDLILLDAHLPDLAGAEVLGRLKQEESTRAIPVVVISADATRRQLEAMNQAGAAAYLTKPLDVPGFLHTIGTVLVNSPVAALPAEQHGQN